MKTIYIITDIERFIARSNDDTGILATHIHKFIIGILEQCGEEVINHSSLPDLQIMWNRESTDTCRKFSVPNELAYLIYEFASVGYLPKVIDKLKNHYIKEGAKVLLSLNNGNITMKEFEDLK